MTLTIGQPVEPAGGASRRRVVGTLRDLIDDRAGLLGGIIMGLVVVVGLFGPLLAPHDPARQDLARRLVPPAWIHGGSWSNVLGTDGLGRDVLSRILHGGRITLVVGVLVCVVAGTVGVLAGLVAGYRGGHTDSAIMTILDTQLAFPGLLLVLMILALIGPSVGAVILLLGINGWMVYARLVRGITLSMRELPYISAARLMGCGAPRVVFRHILPNLAAPLLTLVMLEFARIVLAEAALSYLGYGVQPPSVSWGLMVSEGQQYIRIAWWTITFPGLAIALTVIGINLFASWLRVQSDPRAKEARYAWSAG